MKKLFRKLGFHTKTHYQLSAIDKTATKLELSGLGFSSTEDDEELHDLRAKDKTTTTELQLPKGYRFSPTDEELIDYYLKPAILGKKDGFDTIGLLNIYAHDPWDLPELAKIGGTGTECYFFVQLKRKQQQSNGGILIRTTESGYWTKTDPDHSIRSLSKGDRVIGLKRTLVFYIGKAPYGHMTNWVIQEYTLPESCTLPKIGKGIALCKISNKSEISLRELEQTTAMEKETKVNHDVAPSSNIFSFSELPSSASAPNEDVLSGIAENWLKLFKEFKSDDEHLNRVTANRGTQACSESKDLAEKELMDNIIIDWLLQRFRGEQHNKQVGVDANQTQSSDLLQVSPEKGKNVVVITGDATERKIDGEKLLNDIEVFSDKDPLQEMKNIKEEADSLYKEEECHPPFWHVRHHHGLELMDDLPHQHELITCSICKLNIAPYQCYYACKTCSHYLHLDCSHKFPETVRHAIADRNHDFALRYPSANTTFKCEACGEQGNGFYYHCPQCVTNYHIHCLNMPLSIIHQDHPHELKLEASPPYKAFLCDVCNSPGFDNWLYRCETCEFDVHLGCSTTNPGTQYQFQNQSKLKNEAEIILKNIASTSAHSGCDTTSPGTQSQLQDQSESSVSEAEKKAMDNIPSSAGPSASSPQINPEFDVGISCGNLIAPNRAMRGFHTNEQHKQVTAHANQNNPSDILQVINLENGTNAAVLTGEVAPERKMIEMSKGSDSTKPRTHEPKRGSGYCSWFRCFCYCLIGPMDRYVSAYLKDVD